jgi:hypothetical protein
MGDAPVRRTAFIVDLSHLLRLPAAGDRRLSDRQHRTPRREIGRSCAVFRRRWHRCDMLVDWQRGCRVGP